MTYRARRGRVKGHYRNKPDLHHQTTVQQPHNTILTTLGLANRYTSTHQPSLAGLLCDALHIHPRPSFPGKCNAESDNRPSLNGPKTRSQLNWPKARAIWTGLVQIAPNPTRKRGIQSWPSLEFRCISFEDMRVRLKEAELKLAGGTTSI